MNIPTSGRFQAFAMIVDLNHYAMMVSKAENQRIAEFAAKVLTGPIAAVQKNRGEVVAFMGDAFLAVLPDAESAVFSCWDIARNIDDQCEDISGLQGAAADIWSWAPGGPSIKIGVEFGNIDASPISSRFLGKQCLLAGTAINYASRILKAGEGNRCHVGPVAAAMDGFSSYLSHGPYSVEGKPGEPIHTYFELDMGDLWRDGPREEGKDTYWG